MFRFFGIMVGHALRLRIALRNVPPADWPLFKANRQRICTDRLCKLLRIDVRVVGKIPEDGAMLAISNHLGLLDPFVLSSQMPVAFAAKAEIAEWPVIGWICKLVGVIFVKRDRRMQTSVFVEQVQARIREGIRVLVFPEGTTSDGRGVMPFKTGAFAAVANMEGGSVLPFYMRGLNANGEPVSDTLREAYTWSQGKPMTSHAWNVLGLPNMIVEIHVGEPIATGNRDRKELARRSHEAVINLAGLPSKVDSNA